MLFATFSQQSDFLFSIPPSHLRMYAIATHRICADAAPIYILCMKYFNKMSL